MGFFTLRSSAATGGGGDPFTPWRSATFEFGTNGGSAVNSSDGYDIQNSGTTVSTTRAYSGTKSAVSTVTAGQEFMGGYITLPSVRNGGEIDNNQEFWCRFRCYIPTSWDIGTGDGGMKFFRWRTYNAGEVPAASITVQLLGSGPAPSGLRTECEGVDLDDQLFTPEGGWNDRWATFEFYNRLRNDSTGIIRSWVDGVLRGEVTGINTAASSTWESLHLMFLDFFNNGAPGTQSIWIDEIDVAWSGDASPTEQDAAGNFYMGV